MRFKPVISLHGSGESVVLSNGAHADFTLMQGASGLGVRPQDISSVALPSGGSLVSHRRGTEAVVQLPILLGGTPRKRWDLRRKLERLCAGEVEVRVSRPSGVYRSRFGFYQAGLDGEYGAGEDSPDGQKIVLEIFCPTGLWKGEEQSPEFRLAGLRKRFLSDGPGPIDGELTQSERAPTPSDAGAKGDVWLVGKNAEPERVLRRNLTANPSFEVGTEGWSASNGTLRAHNGFQSRMWEGYGHGPGAQMLEAKSAGYASEYTTVYARPESPVNTKISPGQWFAFSALIAGEQGGVGSGLRSEVTFYGSRTSYAQPLPRGDAKFYSGRRDTLSVQAPATATSASPRFTMHSGTVGENLPSGRRMWIDGVIVAVADTQEEAEALVESYFDGDTPDADGKSYRWTGAPGESASEEYVPAHEFTAADRYKHDGSKWVNVGLEKVSPFLPIVLASSTVQGEITVEIGGDAPAYPTWVIDGPGTDLIIENDKGEHLKVLTEFSEQVTITTDPLMQDIVSPNNPDGELWEFVPTDSKFFPLKPGKNRLKVSMVGAKPNSRVRLLYRETYKAGW